MSTEALIATLARLSRPDNPDRAALARLRRALGPNGFVQAYRHLHEALRDSPDIDDPRRRRPYEIVAAAYGYNPRHAYGFGNSVGAVCAKLAARERGEAAERRFNAMLSAEPDRLAMDIIVLAKRADRASLSLDYARLLDDLRAWEEPSRRIQLSWARDFYAIFKPLSKHDTKNDQEEEEL